MSDFKPLSTMKADEVAPAATPSYVGLVSVQPTQVRRPNRATARTVFQMVVALAAMLPFIVAASGVDETLAPVAGAVAIAGGISRVMALPQVETFLRQFLPFLAAAPAATDRKETRR